MIDYEKKRVYSYHRDFDLSRLRKILSILGNPEKNLKIIHLAGTKGKTSTAFYLKSLLVSEGLRVGLFTSPHIKSPTERIQINFSPISPEELSSRLAQIEELSRKEGIELTYFEALTALALLCFEKAGLDYVILETGLGGRLDATNISSPLLCVLTPIGYDHTQILGRSLFKIAYEKAGILKKGIFFLMGHQRPLIYLWLRILAFFRGAPFKTTPILRAKKSGPGITVFSAPSLSLTFYGPRFASENFCLALRSYYALCHQWPKTQIFHHDLSGRFEILSNGTASVVFDGAHNPMAVAKLCQALEDLLPGTKFVTVFNCMPDKEYKKMLTKLAPLTESFFIPDVPGFSSEEICLFLTRQQIPFERIKPEQFNFLPDKAYLVTGSFYLLDLFREKLGRGKKT